MFLTLIAALAAPAAADVVEHRASVAHAGGTIDAHYRGRIAVSHRQVGAVTPGGIPSSLRCQWQAGLALDRTARHAGGTSARAIVADRVLTGSRPGWCKGQREAIAREVAGRADEVRAHVERLAAEDRDAVVAEAELHADRRAG